ncbi:MAG: GDYXXLXY domain-containing protein [Planctomycetota bacterium]|nr:MAG: GDYXXLXY domain-containing protein [Planctomycetota bacterium]
MNKRLTWFIIAVALQMLILTAVPARKIYTRQTGKAVILKTSPYDPYTIMSGYYVRLTHEISRPQVSREQWRSWPERQGVWVVLKKGDNEIWYADSVHNSSPEHLPNEAVVIKGKKKNDRIVYGIESYFIPENARETVENDLREHSAQARIEVKIDSSGHAAIIKLLIEDRVYQY